MPLIGEIRMFAGNFAPAGWEFCNGQLMAISENDALFTLIGTTYGGDGQETFGLPNLASRVPIHAGQGPDGTNYILGESLGVESVTLTTNQIPAHPHTLFASQAPANAGNPAGNVYATNAQVAYMIEAAPNVNMNASALQAVGGTQPHENCQPFLAISYIISLFGVFPQQS